MVISHDTLVLIMDLSIISIYQVSVATIFLQATDNNNYYGKVPEFKNDDFLPNL